jgi:PST family polysaccharide transporter
MTGDGRWVRFLPVFIRKEIEHRHNLLRILANTGWLFADKLLRAAVGVLVGVWVARYLGPEQFGLFNYATAIVALLTALATLGLNSIVVRDLVRHPEGAAQTLGTACGLQAIGGVLACAMAVAVVAMLRPEDGLAVIVVAILGLQMICRCTDVVKYWFEARVESKYVVWAESAVFLVSASIKILLVLSDATLLGFVCLAFIEAAVIALSLLAVYVRQGNRLAAWRWRYTSAMNLLHHSWPLILSGLAAMIYMRIDQIMLGQMLGDGAVGVYSAALRLSEVWYFIPMSIASSVFPAIIDAKSQNEEVYRQQTQRLLSTMAGLALAIALPITLCGDWLIKLLYGQGFAESGRVLVLHVWSGLFVFLGVAGGRWLIAENLQKFTFYRTLAGCGVSVALNIVLIPRYGPAGAALTSVIAQATASVFFNALSPQTRPLFYMQMKALCGAGLFRPRA